MLAFPENLGTQQISSILLQDPKNSDWDNAKLQLLAIYHFNFDHNAKWQVVS